MEKFSDLTADERKFVLKMTMSVAGATTSEIGAFSSWVIAGAAALFAFVLGSFDKIGAMLNQAALSGSVKLFLVAVALNAVQRYLGAAVAGQVKAAQEGEALAHSLGERAAALRFTRVVDAMSAASPPPARWILRGMSKKIAADDWLAGARMTGRLVQAQPILAVVQVILLVIAGWRLFPSS